MNKIFKDLKNQADSILPDEKFKEELKSQILPQYATSSAKDMQNKKRIFSPRLKGLSLVAAALVVIIVAICIAVPLSTRGGAVSGGDGGDTVVLIDINPSFEIVADEKDSVKSVTGLNSDARIVLLGKNYVGKDLFDVCNDIVLTAIRLNYVHTAADMINIIAYNSNEADESSAISKIQELLTGSIEGKVQLSVTNSEEAKRNLIENIIVQFGQIDGLEEKTITELHRILMKYDVTKEEELDKLEELWEEALEAQGFDDDIAEDIIEEWKEQYLKPLGEGLDEEIEDYIELFELKLIYGGTDEERAEEFAEKEYDRIKNLGDRKVIREFIDQWWTQAEQEYFEIRRSELEQKGLSEEEIERIFEKTREEFLEDLEEKKETISDYLEEYYER